MGNPSLDPADARYLVKRGSGLLVPKDVASLPDATRPNDAPICYDPDGKRRVVMTREEVKAVEKAAKMLARHGFALFMGCHVAHQRPDGRPSCGQLAEPERDQRGQTGFSCQCSRIHRL